MTHIASEVLLLDGAIYEFPCAPLGDLFELTGYRSPFEWTVTSCRRGHIGTWEVIDHRLYLKSLEGGLPGGRTCDHTAVFPDFPDGVFAHWFSREVFLPLDFDAPCPSFLEPKRGLRHLIFERGVLMLDRYIESPSEEHFLSNREDYVNWCAPGFVMRHPDHDYQFIDVNEHYEQAYYGFEEWGEPKERPDLFFKDAVGLRRGCRSEVVKEPPIVDPLGRVPPHAPFGFLQKAWDHFLYHHDRDAELTAFDLWENDHMRRTRHSGYAFCGEDGEPTAWFLTAYDLVGVPYIYKRFRGAPYIG